MVEAGFGRVVFVASNAGLTGYPYTAAYGASKHAMVGLMRALAAEFARSKVTFNAVCPGFIDTEMTERAVQTIVDKTGRTAEQAKKALADLNPQKRLVTVTEVAHAVLMLAAEEAASINGQAIAIDGGQVMS
jgi:NAD(P)-dependent dehydrogenase (short-subunit alcohol dehydrogenase family)